MTRLTLFKQIAKFGLTGIANTLIDFGIFNFLIFITGIKDGWQVGAINAFAVTVAATNSYLLNRNWTFKENQQGSEQPVVKFIIATGIGIIINSLVVMAVSGLTQLLTITSIYILLNIGKILGAFFSITWNFIVYRNWVFNKKKSAPEAPESFLNTTPGLLSIIIPAYNESGRLPVRLRRLAEVASLDMPVEIIVVNDGSSDDTAALSLNVAQDYPFIRCISHPHNLGKGAAVRTGMLASQGEFVVFVDADETFSFDHIKQILNELRSGHEVATGSRQAATGERITGESPLRRLMGKVFNLYVQLILLPGAFDTQCGLKGFRAEAAQEIFTRQRLNGFAFDVEVLTLARALNYDQVAVPVEAEDCEGSSVNRLLSPLQMAWDILRIKAAMLMGFYHLPTVKGLWPEFATGTALFIVALAVRIPWLWHIPRYIDELKEVDLAYSIYLGKVAPLTNMAHDIGSMHNYIMAAIFKLFGPSIYLPRLYVAVTAALTVVLIYRYGLRLFGRWTGLLAAGLLMTNGMHIMVTHMAWANSTTPFFFMLAMLATLNAEQHKSGKWLVAAALFWALTLQTHSSVVIYVLVALVYVFSPHFRRQAEIKPGWYIGGAAVFLIAYSNMIYYNIISRGGSITWLGHKQYALESHPGLASFAVNLQQMFIELMRTVSSTYSETNLLHYLGQPVFMLALILLLWGGYIAYKKGQTLPIWMIVGGMLIIPWINSRYTFFLATRYIMPLVLCSLLLIAYGAVNLTRTAYQHVKNPRLVLVPVTALLLLLVGGQLIPFYVYCGRADTTNLSNKVALKTLSIVKNAVKGNPTIVLVEKDLHLENQPIPYLLTLSHQNYVLVPAKDNPEDTEDPWSIALNKYHNEKLVAVMNKTTYLRLQNSLQNVTAHSLSSQVTFPRPLSIPRTIYVLEIENAPELNSSKESINKPFYASLATKMHIQE